MSAFCAPAAVRCGPQTCRASLLGLPVLLLLAASLAGCESPAPVAETEEVSLPQIQAETITIEPAVWPAVVRSQGNLYADEVSAIGSRVAGRVAEIHVDLGDRVAANDRLATLETEEFKLLVAQSEAQLEQARSALGLRPEDPISKLNPENAPPVRQERAVWEEAKSSLERARQLVRQNAMAAGEFDLVAAAERVAEARYSAALNSVQEKISLIGVRQAELALAKQRLEDAVIVAPFDGLVQSRTASPGAYLNVGDEIAVLVRVNPLRFRGTLPERYAQQIAQGQQVQLQIESVSEPRMAEVTRISPTLDPLSRSLTFEALIENPDGQLRTGLFAEAEVVVAPQAQAVVLPVSAVVRFAGAEKVWKVVDGVAAEQEVFTGQQRGERIEILNGLNPGDVILKNGAEGRIAKILPVGDGEPIKPAAGPAASVTALPLTDSPALADAASSGSEG